MAHRKKTPLTPRRQRMKRPARLQTARHWLARFTGRRVLRSYARWFGVDWECAVKELELLGVTLDQAEVENRRRAMGKRGKQKKGLSLQETVYGEGYGVWWDEDFAYIAGRTSGGFAFGVTWEEAEELPSWEAELSQAEDERAD